LFAGLFRSRPDASFLRIGATVAPTSTRIAPMTNPASLSVLAGRVLLAAVFIPAGFAKLGDLAGNAAYTASGGLPGWFVFPALGLEIVAGLAILVGWQTRWAALGLAVFTLAAGVLYHYLPAQSLEPAQAFVQTLLFQKNLALAGGLLALAGLGAGALSLDARQRRTAALA
jgi:putative oxidoreductase